MPKRKGSYDYGQGPSKRARTGSSKKKLSVKDQLMRLSETKHVVITDTTGPGTGLNASSSWSFYQLQLNPLHGTTSHSRIGDSITPLRLDINASYFIADTRNEVRFVIFQWHMDTESELPTSALTNHNGDNGTMSAVRGFFDYDSRGKYTILYDSGVNSLVGGIKEVENWRIKIGKDKMRKQVAYIDGLASGGTGMFFVAYVSDSAAVSHPNLHLNCQLLYKDM